MPLVLVWSVIVALFPLGSSKSTDSTFEDLRAQDAPTIEHTRRIRLVAFFKKYDAPAPYYIADYLEAAKRHNLDYRLLPAISMIESGAGKSACGDGIRRWGYGRCNGYSFRSVPEGIEYISNALENGDYYRGKTLDEKLKTYNPENPGYASLVRSLMAEIQEFP